MISIGAVYHGPELQGSEVNRLIMRTSKVLKELGGAPTKDGRPWVNAVFVVAGSLDNVDFQGLEFGDYSKKDNGVVVKIAISKESVKGSNVASYLIGALHGVNAMAFEFFRQKGELFPLREAESLVAKTADQLHVIAEEGAHEMNRLR
ncbi:MAG TPA: hypothetical protein VGM97_17215 [Steroidobacteraceae bacterium]|jgi:hypothetical protein